MRRAECPACGYNLAGVPQRGEKCTCPECGRFGVPRFRSPDEPSLRRVLVGAMPFAVLCFVPLMIVQTPRNWYPKDLTPYVYVYCALWALSLMLPVVLDRVRDRGPLEWTRELQACFAVQAAALILALGTFLYWVVSG